MNWARFKKLMMIISGLIALFVVNFKYVIPWISADDVRDDVAGDVFVSIIVIPLEIMCGAIIVLIVSEMIGSLLGWLTYTDDA